METNINNLLSITDIFYICLIGLISILFIMKYAGLKDSEKSCKGEKMYHKGELKVKLAHLYARE